jgi:hypothetical protein
MKPLEEGQNWGARIGFEGVAEGWPKAAGGLESAALGIAIPDWKT